MTNFTGRFIITETPNGRTVPTSVWDADNEADYVNRVRAAHPRSDEAFDLETAEQAAAYDAEAHARTVKLIDEAEFKSWTLDSWDSRVIDRAVRLGWIDAPAAADE